MKGEYEQVMNDYRFEAVGRLDANRLMEKNNEAIVDGTPTAFLNAVTRI